MAFTGAMIGGLQRMTPATRWYRLRAALMRARGYDVSNTARIVSSASFAVGSLEVGGEAFIGHRVNVYGSPHSRVVIGARCDVGPEVSMLAGTHEVAGSDRRAGAGKATEILIEEGCWIGGRATLVGPCRVGAGSVVAAGSIVRSDVPPNSLYFGPRASDLRPLPS